jgi:hypothetical protein
MSSLEVSPLSLDSGLLLPKKKKSRHISNDLQVNASVSPPSSISSLLCRSSPGQHQILERLSTYFFAHSGEGRRRPWREFLLYGMGGNGKSQIALKFADEYGKRSVSP